MELNLCNYKFFNGCFTNCYQIILYHNMFSSVCYIVEIVFKKLTIFNTCYLLFCKYVINDVQWNSTSRIKYLGTNRVYSIKITSKYFHLKIYKGLQLCKITNLNSFFMETKTSSNSFFNPRQHESYQLYGGSFLLDLCIVRRILAFE